MKKFDFNKAKFNNERLAKPVHVIVSLTDIIGCKELSQRDKEPLRFAVEYIKTLERQIVAMELETFGYVPIDSEFVAHQALTRSTPQSCAIAIMARFPFPIGPDEDAMNVPLLVAKRGWTLRKVYW